MKNLFRLPALFVNRGKMAALLALITLLTTTALAQNPPERRAGGNSLVTKLEAKLDKPLTADQRAKIGETSKESADKLKSLQAEFVEKIAKAVNLPASDIQPMMPKIGESNAGFDKNMIPKLEAKLGRKLTTDELAAIRTADAAKKSAMKPVQEKFAKQLAGISGLAIETVRVMLPKVGL